MAVPAPQSPLVMVPIRPSREVVAVLAPLSLALLLPATVLMLTTIDWLPDARKQRMTVVLERSVPLITKTDTPALEMAETLSPTLAEPTVPEPALSPDAQPAAPESLAANSELPKFEMDGLGSAPQIPSELPTASFQKPAVIDVAQASTRATDLAPTSSAGPPIDIVRIDKTSPVVPGLPAVSLPGPSRGPDVEAVAAESAPPFAEGLGTPSAPTVSQIPGPAGSRFTELNFESTALSQQSRGVGADGLVGVPLETLAACSTREREDNLKQQLMRSIESGSQCTGHGGTYAFLEAKNLNAFLMRVSRDMQRALGNRCDELMRAQMCVAAQHVGGMNR